MIGRFGETNASSNLTLDFGFFSPRSLGNRVWLDDGGAAAANDGMINGPKPVSMASWSACIADNDGNGTPDGPAILTTTTSAGAAGDGYYLFSNLPAGQYIVGVDNSNFTAQPWLNGQQHRFCPR